ncbi:MAG TPA: DUF58 domain-containing protein, partial [Anaerolineaceae bacterium]
SPRRGQSVEFADFRPYVAGDDFRRIDWNAYARLERFFIKLFVEEEDLTVHFLVDTSRSMRWGDPNKLGYAARAVGALGYIAMAGLDRVTVTGLFGGSGSGAYFPPHRGKQQAMKLFAFLLGLEKLDASQNSAPNVTRALQNYAATAPAPGPLVIFSDLMDDGWLDGLRALSNRSFEVTVVHLLAPEEAEPALEGDFKLLDAETGASVEITSDYELLARYRAELAAWQADLRHFCAARQMGYVPLLTSVPLEELLFNWLRRTGVLR